MSADGAASAGRRVERWAWASIGLNVLLSGLHALLASASGSLAVAAELVHNASDLLASVAVLVGVRLATRTTRTFPYGLHKVENLVAAGLAGTIFLAAYEIARDALLSTGGPVRAEGWMLAVLAATAALPVAFGHLELRAGLAANSPALVADAREFRLHAFTTGLALATLAAQRIGWPVDRLAALAIVGVVARTGWTLLADAMRVLLDASLDASTLGQVRDTVQRDPAVSAVHWVMGRNAGRFRFVEAGVALRADAPTRAAAVVRRLEAQVRAAVPHVERVVVRVEPPVATTVRYAVPLADTEGTVSPHFGSAPWFALLAVRREDGAIERREVLANPCRAEDQARGIRTAEWLVAQKVDVLLTRDELRGPGPVHVLRDAGVEHRRTGAAALGEVPALARGEREAGPEARGGPAPDAGRPRPGSGVS